MYEIIKEIEEAHDAYMRKTNPELVGQTLLDEKDNPIYFSEENTITVIYREAKF